MTNWMRVAFIATTLLLVSIGWVIYQRTTRLAPESMALTDQKNDFGVPKAVKRIDASIDLAGSLEFAELCNSLSVYDQSFELAYTAGMSHSSPTPPVIYKQVIADRRVAKLFAFLQSRPIDEASQATAQLFDQKLKEMSTAWLNEAATQGSVEQTLQHAVAAALFLCVWFCEDEVVGEKADAWIAWFDGFEPRYSFFEMDARPPWMFLLNCYMNVIERRGESRDAMNARLDRLEKEVGTELPRLAPTAVYQWDTPTLPTDFTHMHRDAPVNEDDVLQALSGFHEHPAAGVTFDVATQEKVLELARDWISEAPQ